ncbi:MAG: hypothetical protein ACREI9_04740 [Nitrospiraceae bacterium]
MMKHAPLRFRFRPVRRLEPRLALVNSREPQQGYAPSPSPAAPPSPFNPDGFIYPKAQDVFFDVAIRVPTLAVNSTTIQRVFNADENAKGGWIRSLGYGFNNPHGFFQVRTTILINGAPPGRYVFKTVDASNPVTFSGSFPPVQIGTVQKPTDVFIQVPSSSIVEVRFVNASLDEAFACAVRLKGWFSGN